MLDEKMLKRILNVLHLGLVEARLLAQRDASTQLFDLMDALEPVPHYLSKWADENIDRIRSDLATYTQKYGRRPFDYPVLVDQDEPPESFQHAPGGSESSLTGAESVQNGKSKTGMESESGETMPASRAAARV